jgi:hypothetical protein
MSLKRPFLSCFALLLVAFIQPVLVWNNPNLYFTLGALLSLLPLARIFISKELDSQPTVQVALAVSFIVVGLLGPVMSGFSAQQRILLSGLPKQSSSSGLPVLDNAHVSLLTRTSAIEALQRKLDDDESLNSEFRIGSPVKQVFRGELVWVAPIEPRSALKAFFGKTAPGYAMVKASDVTSAQLVKFNIAYSNRMAIGLDTRVWFHNPSLDVYGWYFELSDDGVPHWVGILTKRTIGFRGYDVVGAVLVDVSTGEQTRYTRDKIPYWVNNKFPMELVAAQINAAGDLVNGLFELSDAGKFELDTGLTMVFFDNKAWYLGLVSNVVRDSRLKEVVLVDTETRAVRRVALCGITAYTAANVLQAEGPEKGLTSSRPVPYLSNGIPAYVASLADRFGVPRAYGLVAVKDAQVSAVAGSLAEAEAKFAARAAIDRPHLVLANDLLHQQCTN